MRRAAAVIVDMLLVAGIVGFDSCLVVIECREIRLAVWCAGKCSMASSVGCRMRMRGNLRV
jgi:hypothetical protein